MKFRILAVAAAAVFAGMAASPATASAAPSIRFGTIQYDVPGSDTPVTNAKLNKEFALVRNTGRRAVQLKGFTVRDAQNHGYTFQKLALGPGQAVKLHTGSGRNTATDVYWGQKNYVWNNGGDTAKLRNAAGTVTHTCKWTSTGTGKIVCR